MEWMQTHPLVKILAGNCVKMVSPTVGECLNSYALVPAFPAFLGKLSKVDSSSGKISPHLKRLPYLLNSCLASLDILQRGHSQIIAELTNELKVGDIKIGSPLQRASLSVPLESFIMYSILVQDSWYHLLNFALPKNSGTLPSSFNDLIKGIESEKKPSSLLSEHHKKGLLKYWQMHGSLLRNYRDYALHFGEVCSDLKIFKNSTNEVAVIMLLLNNPELKSPQKACWGNPHIHVLLYAISEFEALVSFTNWIINTFFAKNEKQISMRIELAAPSIPTFAGSGIEHKGVTAPNPDWIKDIIYKAVDMYNPLKPNKQHSEP
jgi:hypothetical protein